MSDDEFRAFKTHERRLSPSGGKATRPAVPRSLSDDVSTFGGDGCRGFSQQADTPHPNLNDADGIRFRRLKIRNSSGVLPLSADIGTTSMDTDLQLSPYRTCFVSQSSFDFDAKRASSC
jgi:hypothetical protein